MGRKAKQSEASEDLPKSEPTAVTSDLAGWEIRFSAWIDMITSSVLGKLDLYSKEVAHKIKDRAVACMRLGSSTLEQNHNIFGITQEEARIGFNELIYDAMKSPQVQMHLHINPGKIKYADLSHNVALCIVILSLLHRKNTRNPSTSTPL